ncbi:MAG: hypothetical protein K2O84_07040, partial [Oscillospiraceae bacterium]|nr:hypothetical protein [Oscillospiraceae bacterium]
MKTKRSLASVALELAAVLLAASLAGCTAPAVPTAGAVPAISAPVTVIQPEEQAVSAADLWSDDRSRTGTPLL